MSNGRSFVTTFKTKAETEGISKMQKHLKELQASMRDNRREQKELSKEIRDAKAEITAINKEIKETGKTTEEQEHRLKKLQAVVDNDNKALERLRVQQSQLQTEINNTNKQIDNERKALDKLKTSIDDAKKYSKELVKEFGAMGAAAVAAVAGLFAFTHDAAQWADNLNTLSKTTGISTEELQKFTYAADLIDVSVDTITGSLTKLTRNMAEPSKAAEEAFRTLKIEITDASGQLRDREEVFYEVIDALGRIENVTERDALAMNIFGKSAQELNPLIMGGAQTLKQLGDEAERAGLILGQDVLDNLNAFNDKIDLLKAKGTAIKNLAASEMTPALDGLLEAADELLDEIKEMAKSGELKSMAKEAGQIIKKGVTDLKNLINFVWKYKDAISGVITAMVTFKVAMNIANLIQSLGSALSVLAGKTTAATLAQQGLNTAMAMNPIGAVCAAVAALTMGIVAYTGVAQAASGATDDLNVKTKGYTEALKSAKEQQEQTIANAHGEAEKIRVLQNEYNELRNKTSLSNVERERLSRTAESLADTIGIEKSKLQDLSGAYIDLNTQIDICIDNLIKKAQQESMYDIIKEAAAAQFNLEEPLKKAKEEYEKAHKQFQDFVKNNAAVKEMAEFSGDSKVLREYEEKLDRLEKKYKKASGIYADLQFQYDKATNSLNSATNALKKYGDTADSTTNSISDLTEAMEDNQKTSSSLRSELSSLASSYNSLTEGQKLSFDALMDLIDKYPDYAEALLNAADNADAQKIALEALFEAKKQEYILTQQAAIDKIKASNDETQAIIDNTEKQIKAQEELIKTKELSSDGARAEKFGREAKGIAEARAELEKLNDWYYKQENARELYLTLGRNEDKIDELNRKIALAQGLSIGDYSGTKKSSSGSGSGSGGSSGSGSTTSLWSMDSHGVYASGNSYIQAYTNWISRMKSLGKMTTDWEIRLLEEMLRREQNTADERYEVENQLYQAREKLAKEQQDALAERQKLALAAFNKLTNDKIELYNKEAQAAQDAADKEIAALDELSKKRKQEQEDKKRQDELDRINARLSYEKMDEFTRHELERQRQDILNEIANVEFDRHIETSKSGIQTRNAAAQERIKQAVAGLNEAKTAMSDRVAYLQGNQSYDQRVSNNSKTVNINLISNGLTEDQAAKRIAQKVIKDLG